MKLTLKHKSPVCIFNINPLSRISLYQSRKILKNQKKKKKLSFFFFFFQWFFKSEAKKTKKKGKKVLLKNYDLNEKQRKPRSDNIV